MEIKIEKDVPIPQAKWYADVYGMKKHDSFVFPIEKFGNIRNAVMKVKKVHQSRKFKTMRISETERRIWRTR